MLIYCVSFNIFKASSAAGLRDRTGIGESLATLAQFDLYRLRHLADCDSDADNEADIEHHDDSVSETSLVAVSETDINGLGSTETVCSSLDPRCDAKAIQLGMEPSVSAYLPVYSMTAACASDMICIESPEKIEVSLIGPGVAVSSSVAPESGHNIMRRLLSQSMVLSVCIRVFFHLVCLAIIHAATLKFIVFYSLHMFLIILTHLHTYIYMLQHVSHGSERRSIHEFLEVIQQNIASDIEELIDDQSDEESDAEVSSDDIDLVGDQNIGELSETEPINVEMKRFRTK